MFVFVCVCSPLLAFAIVDVIWRVSYCCVVACFVRVRLQLFVFVCGCSLLFAFARVCVCVRLCLYLIHVVIVFLLCLHVLTFVFVFICLSSYDVASVCSFSFVSVRPCLPLLAFNRVCLSLFVWNCFR